MNVRSLLPSLVMLPVLVATAGCYATQLSGGASASRRFTVVEEEGVFEVRAPGGGELLIESFGRGDASCELRMGAGERPVVSFRMAGTGQKRVKLAEGDHGFLSVRHSGKDSISISLTISLEVAGEIPEGRRPDILRTKGDGSSDCTSRGLWGSGVTWGGRRAFSANGGFEERGQ